MTSNPLAAVVGALLDHTAKLPQDESLADLHITLAPT
jgi:hypothetical protein